MLSLFSIFLGYLVKLPQHGKICSLKLKSNLEADQEGIEKRRIGAYNTIKKR